MNTAISVAVGALSIIAALGAMFRWFKVSLLESLDAQIDAKLDGRFETIDRRFDAVDARFDAVDARFDAMDMRFERLESRVDHGFEMTNLRLEHLEGDMVLVKKHLLGSAA
ncbi:hypothetical protein [Nocardioides montaniterrae]